MKTAITSHHNCNIRVVADSVLNGLIKFFLKNQQISIIYHHACFTDGETEVQEI